MEKRSGCRDVTEHKIITRINGDDNGEIKKFLSECDEESEGNFELLGTSMSTYKNDNGDVIDTILFVYRGCTILLDE